MKRLQTRDYNRTEISEISLSLFPLKIRFCLCIKQMLKRGIVG